MKIFYENRKINLHVREVGFFGKIWGLMFSSKEHENLLFSFNKSTRIAIHSFFVFYSFLAVYLDNKNRVLEFRIVKPFDFHVKPRKVFRKLVEIPLNSRNKRIIATFI